MTSLERKMEKVKEKFKRAKPICQTFYSTLVMGYGSFDDGDDNYLDSYELMIWQGKDN